MTAKMSIGLCMAAGLFLAAGCLCAQSVSSNTNLTAREEQIIAAAKAGAAPQFNGARIVGIRPGTPLVYSLAVSGAHPLEFSAKKLPDGLSLDPNTGIISGSLNRAGEYTVKVAAKNSAGKAKTKIKIVCGDTLALTPPMGWNSYDAFGDSVVESEVMANARYVAEKMQHVGWDTIVVDY